MLTALDVAWVNKLLSKTYFSYYCVSTFTATFD